MTHLYSKVLLHSCSCFYQLLLWCTLFALYLLSALFSLAARALCASKQILIAHYQPFVRITFFQAGTARYHPQKVELSDDQC